MGTTILGHRGDTESYASSTKESVLSALEKCDGVELDLNVSRDGVFYFYHEQDWTTELLARRYTFAELALFMPCGEALLSLQEGLELVKRAHKVLLVHAEVGGGGDHWARDFTGPELQDVLSIIKQSGINTSRVLFHTVKPAKARELDGHIVFDRRPGVSRGRYGMYRFGPLSKALGYIDPSTTMAYVINDERQLRKLRDWGIGYILTDRLF